MNAAWTGLKHFRFWMEAGGKDEGHAVLNEQGAIRALHLEHGGYCVVSNEKSIQLLRFSVSPSPLVLSPDQVLMSHIPTFRRQVATDKLTSWFVLCRCAAAGRKQNSHITLQVSRLHSPLELFNTIRDVCDWEQSIFRLGKNQIGLSCASAVHVRSPFRCNTRIMRQIRELSKEETTSSTKCPYMTHPPSLCQLRNLRLAHSRQDCPVAHAWWVAGPYDKRLPPSKSLALLIWGSGPSRSGFFSDKRSHSHLAALNI